MRLRRLFIKRFERVIEEKTLTFTLDLALEALNSRFIKLELSFSKKFKRNFRVSIARTIFKKN